MLQALNILFFVVHSALMLFNLLGWYWPQTRRWHLATIGLTLASWFVMGAWRGWGYCLCADWHFQIRRDLGIHDPETAYLQLQVRVLTGYSMSRTMSDVITVSCLILILIATGWVWVSRYNRTQPTRTNDATVDDT